MGGSLLLPILSENGWQVRSKSGQKEVVREQKEGATKHKGEQSMLSPFILPNLCILRFISYFFNAALLHLE